MTRHRPGVTGPRPFLGYQEEILQDFGALPNRRLVITGEPGSGKSAYALLLTLGLLRSRISGALPERRNEVTVLLSLNQWVAGTESFPEWVTRRLTETYPFLGDSKVTGPLRPSAL